MMNGKNVFLTGAGGSGKTTLIRHVYERGRHTRRIQVCAMTGCAAILLQCGARTLHSFTGIGLARGLNRDILDRIMTSTRFQYTILKRLDTLIVDEVSMMSLKIFELIDDLFRRIRQQPTVPFGGLQVIFSGDFFQLPPVPDPDDPTTGQFCFESERWFTVFSHKNHIVLERLYRQLGDPVYSDILEKIRQGLSLNDHECELLGTRFDTTHTETHRVRLFPTRYLVEKTNQEEMERLPSDDPQFTYTIREERGIISRKPLSPKTFSESDIQRELLYLRRNILCDEHLVLKKGCRVMCIVNKNSGDDKQNIIVCNGHQGVVTGFRVCPRTREHVPLVRFDGFDHDIDMPRHIWESELIPSIGLSGIPLILAWAVTIHKAQGLTLDNAEIDVGKGIFDFGQTYVALSRVRSLEGLSLKAFDPSRILADPKIIAFYQSIKPSDNR